MRTIRSHVALRPQRVNKVFILMFVLLFCALSTQRANAQIDTLPALPATTPEDMEIRVIRGRADVMPLFDNGGVDSFRRWLRRNLSYPVKAIEEDVEGRVVVSFVVRRDGVVSGVEVKESISPILSDAVVQLLERSPIWTPGKRGERPVKTTYLLPVVFSLIDKPVQ